MNVPTDPGQHADERLRAYAAARRAAPTQEPHPATRRLLVDEAVRVHGRAGAPAGGRERPPWWRWAWTLGGAGALGVAALLLRPVMQPEAGRQLARLEAAPAREAAPTTNSAPPAAVPAAEELSAAVTEEEESAGRAGAAEVDLAGEPGVAPGRTFAGGRIVTLGDRAAAAGQPGGLAEPAAAAPGPLRLLATESLGAPAPAPAQRFERRRAGRSGAGDGSPLQRFTLALNGTRVLLTDADGSQYPGEAAPAAAPAAGAARAETEARPFRVAGTNRATGRLLVVTGWVTVAPLPLPATGGAGAAQVLLLSGTLAAEGAAPVEFQAAPVRAETPPTE
jgi:hypothetical protein